MRHCYNAKAILHIHFPLKQWFFFQRAVLASVWNWGAARRGCGEGVRRRRKREESKERRANRVWKDLPRGYQLTVCSCLQPLQWSPWQQCFQICPLPASLLPSLPRCLPPSLPPSLCHHKHTLLMRLRNASPLFPVGHLRSCSTRGDRTVSECMCLSGSARLSASDSTFCKSPSVVSLKIRQLRHRVFRALKISKTCNKEKNPHRATPRKSTSCSTQRLKLRESALKLVVTTVFFVFVFFYVIREA